MTIGLPMPDDFASDSREAVASRLEPLHNTYPICWSEHIGAWNAIEYRFYACAEYSDSFTNSIKLHRIPSPQERYRQERDLYGFFVSGLSVIESFCYGLFAIAAMLQEENFQTIKHRGKEVVLWTDPNPWSKDRRLINPERTEQKFRETFSQEDITKALHKLLTDDPAYEDWKRRRNVLAHT